MKIAQLSTRFPPGPGGVERHAYEISKRLGARGHQVDAFASDLYREYPWEHLAPSVPRTERKDDFTIHRLKVWSLHGELHYPLFRGLGRALARVRPDILHVHTYGTHHAAVTRRYARRAHVPWVMTAHYHPLWSIEGGWLRHQVRKFYDQHLAAPIVADAARLIVQSREELRLIQENGFPLPPISFIAPGYTPLPTPDPETPPFGPSVGVPGPYLLFVGRLASNKGLIPLVQAFVPLSRHDPNARLVIVGEDGGMRPAVEREIARQGLAGQVVLAGYLEDEARLAAAFQGARLVVLPSEYEAFGLVLLEALAQGTPVVASRVGGIPEFIPDGEAGRLVTPNDVAALSATLLELWDDERALQRMGTFGRDVVVPKYSWDRVTDQLEGLYREVRDR